MTGKDYYRVIGLLELYGYAPGLIKDMIIDLIRAEAEEEEEED